jgi:hypothetical protein
MNESSKNQAPSSREDPNSNHQTDGSSSEIESEENWLRAVASSQAFAFLADSAEDIYTRADGEPFRDAE